MEVRSIVTGESLEVRVGVQSRCGDSMPEQRVKIGSLEGPEFWSQSELSWGLILEGRRGKRELPLSVW